MVPGRVEAYDHKDVGLTVLTRVRGVAPYAHAGWRAPPDRWIRIQVPDDTTDFSFVPESEWEWRAPWCSLRPAPAAWWRQATAERQELEILLCLAAVALLPGEVTEIVAAFAAWVLPARKRGA